jgi:hypothetical protein
MLFDKVHRRLFILLLSKDIFIQFMFWTLNECLFWIVCTDHRDQGILYFQILCYMMIAYILPYKLVFLKVTSVMGKDDLLCTNPSQYLWKKYYQSDNKNNFFAYKANLWWFNIKEYVMYEWTHMVSQPYFHQFELKDNLSMHVAFSCQ